MKPLIKVICFCGLIAASLLTCEDTSDQQRSSTSQPATPPSQQRSMEGQTAEPAGSSPSTIPGDVTYTIIDTEVVPGIKRSLNVRLSRKVSNDVLRLIALELKGLDSKNYERTFLAYYLPGMKVGAGAWATTHFDPDLRVRILGSTSEREEVPVKEQQDPSREIVGAWLDDSPVIGSRIMIYRKNHKFYMEQKYKNGSTSTTEMVEKASSKGRRFENKEGSSSGDHYLIDRNGNLQMRDLYGLVATARKLK